MTDEPSRADFLAEIAQLTRQVRERDAELASLRRAARKDGAALVADAVPDVITRVDRDLRYTYCNPAAEVLAGMPRESFIGRRSVILRTPGCEHVAVAYRSVFNSGRPATVEYSLATPAGRRVFQSHMVPEFGESRAVESVLSVARDVTALRDAEEALRRSRGEFQALAENAADVIMRFDLDLNTVYANAALERVTGTPLSLAIGRPPRLLLRPNGEGERWRARFLDIIARGEPSVIDYDVQTPGGLRYFQSNLVPEFGESGRIESLLSIARDITALKDAERALSASEARLRELLADLPIGVALLRPPDWHIEFANGAAERFGIYAGPRSGREVIDALASPVDEFGEPVPELERPVPSAIATGQPARAAVMGYPREDGALRWMLVDAHPVHDEHEGLRDVIVTFTDITERKEAERHIRESESGFRAVVEAVPSPMWIDWGADTVFVNEALVQLTGYPREQLGQPGVYRQLFSERDHALIASHTRARLADEPAPERFEVTLITAAGKARVLELRDALISRGGERAVLLCGFDLTERKLAEEERQRMDLQVQHAQKLESLGVLAGGIAHDFNNLLVAILGNASLALLELPPESTARQTVEAIETAAQRAAELTRQMLAYSGKGRFVIEPLNLSRLVEEMAHLLRVAVSKRATLTYDFPEGGPLVEGDATQLRQVVMNLITNASDAIGDGEGRITIATGVRHVTRADLATTYVESDLEDGEYAFIEVVDSGSGMDDETRQRIFEPFFSTKFTGRGLGLAAVLGIVRGHRGAITIASSPGAGSNFRVFLPLTDAAASADATRSDVGTATPATGRTVLLVDDDESVRTVGRALLERLGFGVLVAAGASEAIAAFAARHNAIDLVLLDLTMPVMDGEATFRALRAIDPAARVVLMSGYNEGDAAEQFAISGIAGFIQKPFRGPDLLARLNAALES